ncbi:MAG TPA: hypothetical protein ENJ09_02520 [Planctomycetes bacterium]|nr:hypothetical protein [Planctomycetota bacterium]
MNRIRPGSVPGWVRDVLLSPERDKPVVAVTTPPKRRDPWMDPELLEASLEGAADVVLLQTGKATWALAEALPDRLDVYGGALRIWWPGLHRASDPYEHELIFVYGEGDAKRAARKIVKSILGESAELSEELVSSLQVATAAPLEPKRRDGREGGPSDRAVEELEDELNSMSADRKRALEENEKLRKKVAELRKKLKSVKGRLESSSGQEDDPLRSGTDFLLGVRLAYARTHDEGTRHQYPLGRMRVGHSFMECLRDLQGVELSKVLEVCAQVASGIAHTIAGREVHQLRAGPAGSRSRTRKSDGAQAWRCALQTHTPGARRLHWWATSGSQEPTVEFASVGHHDDFDIPE